MEKKRKLEENENIQKQSIDNKNSDNQKNYTNDDKNSINTDIDDPLYSFFNIFIDFSIYIKFNIQILEKLLKETFSDNLLHVPIILGRFLTTYNSCLVDLVNSFDLYHRSEFFRHLGSALNDYNKLLENINK